jgi:TonB family protein
MARFLRWCIQVVLCRPPARLWFRLLPILAITIGATILLTHGQEGVALQQKPLTAGEIALMVRRGGEPEVIEAWRRALREGGPHERAAVARVAHVGRVAVLAGDLETSLEKETEYLPALECAAALASMTGPERDKRLLEAGKRLGDGALAQVGLILARARRAEAIRAYLNEVRPALDADTELVEFVRLATLMDSSSLGPAAAAALEAGDVAMWLAVLDVSVKSDSLLETNLLASALRHPAAEISGRTAWQLAMAFAGKPASRWSELLPNLDAGAGGQRSRPSDIDRSMGVELLARVLGREPVEDKAWISYLQGPGGSRIDEFDTLTTLTQYLTSSERKVLKKRLARLRPEIKVPHVPRALRAAAKAAMDPQEPRPVVRMANGFPQRFVSEAVAASGCSLEATPVLGEAEVSYDDLGRPVKVRLLRIPASPKCVEAITALFASTLKPLNDFSGPEKPQTLFLVLEQGYLSRLEEDPAPDSKAVFISQSISEAPSVVPPKRVHFVKPVYPGTAQAGRKAGKVILEVVVNRQGLISDIRLLKQTDQEFVSPTFAAVAKWRYAPAMIGGQPVRVYLTVIVEFSLS